MTNESFLSLLFFAGFFALIAGVVFFAVYMFIKRQKMLKNFALENGYLFTKSGSLDDVPSLYLQIGHSRRIHNIISGQYDGKPIKFFDFHSTIGYGKHKRQIRMSAWEIEYPSSLRRFLLLSRKMRFGPGNLYDGFKNGFGREIQLEGDFHKYFKLYVPEDYEIEVLQIFTPDIMVKFINLASDFTFEFVDNKLLIYSRRLVFKKETLEKMHELAKTLIHDLAPRLSKV